MRMMWLLKLSCITMLIPALCKETLKGGGRSSPEMEMNISTPINTLNHTMNTLPLVIDITNTSGSEA